MNKEILENLLKAGIPCDVWYCIDKNVIHHETYQIIDGRKCAYILNDDANETSDCFEDVDFDIGNHNIVRFEPAWHLIDLDFQKALTILEIYRAYWVINLKDGYILNQAPETRYTGEIPVKTLEQAIKTIINLEA